jgi:hypothetical protein
MRWSPLIWLRLRLFPQRKVVKLDAVHRYYCEHCKRAIFGGDTGELAIAVNDHNKKLHPMEFAGWVARTILRSTHYAGPSEPPPYIVPYTQPETAEWGGAKAPDITEKDKKMLAHGLVKW